MANAGQSLFGMAVGVVALWILLQLFVFAPLEAVLTAPVASLVLYGLGIAVIFHGLTRSKYGDAMVGLMIVVATWLNSSI